MNCLPNLPSDIVSHVLEFLGARQFEQSLEISNRRFLELGRRAEFLKQKRKLKQRETMAIFCRGVRLEDSALIKRAADLGLPSARAELAYRMWKEHFHDSAFLPRNNIFALNMLSTAIVNFERAALGFCPERDVVECPWAVLRLVELEILLKSNRGQLWPGMRSVVPSVNFMPGLGAVALAFVRLRESITEKPRKEYESRATQTEVLLRVTAEEQERTREHANDELLLLLSKIIKERAGDDSTLREKAREFYYKSVRARGESGCSSY